MQLVYLTGLTGYDYSSAGAYFVTICVKNRECLFGEIQNGKMILNEFGKIIDYHWKNIPVHFENVELDQFIVAKRPVKNCGSACLPPGRKFP